MKKDFKNTISQAAAYLAVLAIVALIVTACVVEIIKLVQSVRLRPAEEPVPAEPAEGVAWIMPEAGEAAVWMAPACAEDVMAAYLLKEYTEGDGPAPEWYRPDEPMSAEWADHSGEGTKMVAEDHFPDTGKMVDEDINVTCSAPEGIDPGGIDWNICTDLVGWDGHRAEAWELDLFARVFYLEFWGTSLPCSEAGCDAILNLWASGKYGRTLFEALSYYDPKYGYTYRVYPHVWETDYDADGLEWCREFCTGRFINGPEWECVYFQLGGYHDTDWVPPLYEMDGVFFSGASEG